MYGAQKCEWLAAGDIMVMPSAVGLSILDAFAARMPLATTDLRNHGPEIAYIENGVNGLITSPDPDAYAAALVNVLGNPQKLRTMSEAASASVKKYSFEEMISRFEEGVHEALGR